jgi:hypothetical protein
MPASGWSNSRISWKAIIDFLSGQNFLDDKLMKRPSSIAFLTPRQSAASLAEALPRSPPRDAGTLQSIAQRGGVGAGNGEQIYVGVAILILFWRTDRRTGVAAVEGR